MKKNLKVIKAEKPTPEELEKIELDEHPAVNAPNTFSEPVELGSVEKEPELDPFGPPSEEEVEQMDALSPVKSDEPLSGRPMNEEEIRNIDPSPYYDKVGFPVLFEGTHAAIITKVWERGLVNLIIFHDGSPVPDLKTSVPYGEGPNTWKEIN